MVFAFRFLPRIFLRIMAGLLIIGSAGADLWAAPRAAAKKKTAHAVEKNSSFDIQIRQKGAMLDSIKQELRRGHARIDTLARQESGYLSQLNELEKNIATAQTYTRMVGGRIDQLTRRIDSLEYAIEVTGKELKQRQRIMEQRLRAMYKSPPASWLQLLFESRDPAEGIKRARMFAMINRYDRILLQSIDSSRARLSWQRTQLQEDRTAQTALKTEKEHEQTSLMQEQDKRSTILKDVRSQKQSYAKMVRELEESQAQINVLIKTLEKQRKKALATKKETEKIISGVFAKNKGKLSWPVQGKIIGRFGKVEHPVFKTITMNNGIDIRADQGSPVSCVADGTVIYIGWMRGLGRFAVVDHQGGYLSIYAHLDGVSVSQNEPITRGDILGLVGETGSLNGAQLHFEIRLQTEALDPLEWLAQ